MQTTPSLFREPRPETGGCYSRQGVSQGEPVGRRQAPACLSSVQTRRGSHRSAAVSPTPVRRAAPPCLVRRGAFFDPAPSRRTRRGMRSVTGVVGAVQPRYGHSRYDGHPFLGAIE